jgi:hypothetical protein
MWHLATSMWYDNALQTFQGKLQMDLIHVYALKEYSLFPCHGMVADVSVAYEFTFISNLEYAWAFVSHPITSLVRTLRCCMSTSNSANSGPEPLNAADNASI